MKVYIVREEYQNILAIYSTLLKAKEDVAKRKKENMEMLKIVEDPHPASYTIAIWAVK